VGKLVLYFAVLWILERQHEFGKQIAGDAVLSFNGVGGVFGGGGRCAWAIC